LHIKSKNSILKAITLIGFITALLLITTALLLGYIAITNDKTSAIKQSIVLYEKLHKYKVEDKLLQKYLQRNHLTMVTLDEAKAIMKRGKQLITDKDIHKTLHDANIEIFVENKHYFYAYKADADMFYFINEAPMTPIPKYLTFGTFILLGLLFLLYRFIKSLDLAQLISEFLFIHPFCEGNGRLSRLVCDIILAKNCFPMIGLNLKNGDNYIQKVHQGYNCDYEPMKELLKSKIEEIMNG